MLSTLDRFATALRRPLSFAERGVHMPFTTPLLFGARLRANASGQVELVVLPPDGQSFWLVMPWAAAADAFDPSLADHALMDMIDSSALNPVGVRAAVRCVAAAGLLGRAARRAASKPGHLRSPAVLAAALADWDRHAPTDADRRHAAALRALGAAVAAAGAMLDPERRAALEDGWSLLAALWETTEGKARPVLLRRLAALAPPLPEEATSWPPCQGIPQSTPPRVSSGPGFATQSQCEAAVTAWLAGAA